MMGTIAIPFGQERKVMTESTDAATLVDETCYAILDAERKVMTHDAATRDGDYCNSIRIRSATI